MILSFLLRASAAREGLRLLLFLFLIEGQAIIVQESD